VILAVNETTLDSVEDLDRVLSRLEPGASLALLVLRDGHAAYVALRIPGTPARPGGSRGAYSLPTSQ